MNSSFLNKAEGDINTTEERSRWQQTFLSDKSKKLLEEDSKYFLHQALSTPCLDPIASVDGIYITDEMKKNIQAVGDVRLVGALLGIELVKDRKTKEKAVDEAEKILYYCLENGLSFKISQGNVLTLAPPLIITEEELEHAMDIVESGIRKYLQ